MLIEIGIDLVAMNVNDLVVQGAEALMFLDCFSCSKLDPSVAASFVTGLAEGCVQAGCALIGGETAEMPGIYQGGEYDVVGAAIGATQRDQILPKMDEMVAGDILLGLASSGVHSNGFSLVRKILETKGLSYQDPAPWDSSTSVGLSLLTPTRIYAKQLHDISRKNLIKGMAHITGGGLTDNIPRMLPKSFSPEAKAEGEYRLTAELNASQWPLLPVMKWLREAGNMDWSEFARTFNSGIGMAIVISKENLVQVRKELEDAGETVYEIGQLIRGDSRGPCLIQGW
jgi:phosphoribosylaminoimidazole synthetase